MIVFEKDTGILDRCSTPQNLLAFIDNYGVGVEVSQNSFFYLSLEDFDNYTEDYPTHADAIKELKQVMEDKNYKQVVVLFWW